TAEPASEGRAARDGAASTPHATRTDNKAGKPRMLLLPQFLLFFYKEHRSEIMIEVEGISCRLLLSMRPSAAGKQQHGQGARGQRQHGGAAANPYNPH